jgi:hypothetical protein
MQFQAAKAFFLIVEKWNFTAVESIFILQIRKNSMV